MDVDEHERAEGLGTVAQGGVIVAVFAVIYLIYTLTQANPS